MLIVPVVSNVHASFMSIFYCCLFVIILLGKFSMPASWQKKATINFETNVVIESTKSPVGASVNFYPGKQIAATNDRCGWVVKKNLNWDYPFRICLM